MKPSEWLQIDILVLGLGANEILLQQVLVRKTGCSSEKLVEAAYRTFRDALRIAQRQETSGISPSDRLGLLCAQGMQSAAIVAVELLRQEQQRASGGAVGLLPRSQAIQELAIFVGTLDAAARELTDGWFHMSETGRRLIRRILDKLLAPVVPSMPQQEVVPQDGSASSESAGDAGGAVANIGGSGWGQEAGGYMMNDVTPLVWDIDPMLNAPVLALDGDFMQWLENV